MISSRHIIVFNTFNTTENLNINGEYTGYKGTCEGDHLIVPQEFLSRFDVDLEYLKNFNVRRKFHNTIAKVTVMNGCKELLPSNPMILELIAPLENNTVPVCISGCARNWERVSGFSVYGVDGPGRLVSGRFRPIECSASSPFSCAEASNKAYQGLCHGDYGGSAIANIDQRHVMLGFYAGDNDECQGNTETMDPFKFVNLGHYRQEICETTGVCVPPCEVDVTPGPQTEAPSTTVASEEENTTTAEEEYYTHEVLSTDPQVPYEEPGTLKNTTAPAHVSVSGEEIKAETFAPLIVSNSSTEGDVTNAEIFDLTRIGFDGEVINAETFEPMKIDHRGSTRADRIRDIHIHIHLNK
ncbi:hypothetical protein L5515_006102 [Caenorhabditis briggsae]|nr:hypothetical protein L5515_006102 [Caenorhabditis briggsae]